MYELLFVGSGPHCLTALLRLLEPHADGSIDQPRRHARPKAAVLRLWQQQRSDAGRRRELRAWLAERVAVVDSGGRWLGRWSRQFAGLSIAHLRSTSGVHPDPLDTYCLATFAASCGRLGELLPLEHVAKSEHFHGPFHAPGSRLFEDFCADLVRRYALDRLVTRDEVVSLTPVFATSNGAQAGAAPAPAAVADAQRPAAAQVTHWLVGLASGRQLAARRVVLGIGSTNRPRIPEALQHLQPVVGCAGVASSRCAAASSGGSMSTASSADTCSGDGTEAAGSSSSSSGSTPAAVAPADAPGSFPAGRLLHAWQLAEEVAGASAGPAQPASAALRRLGLLLPGEAVAVIGGGLTAAHLAQVAAAAGASRVSVLMRGGWRVKQFDADLPWMGRTRGAQLRAFARESSFERRAALLKEALQGGSMPPEAAAVLRRLQQQPAPEGGPVLDVQQHAEVVAADWDWDARHWQLWLQDGHELRAQRLWLATGSVVHAASEPLMRQLQERLPVHMCGGLPAIQPTLEWSPGSRLFVLGAYAALQLGPGALNLAGAKTASVVLARQLGGLLRPPAAAASGGGVGGSVGKQPGSEAAAAAADAKAAEGCRRCKRRRQRSAWRRGAAEC